MPDDLDLTPSAEPAPTRPLPELTTDRDGWTYLGGRVVSIGAEPSTITIDPGYVSQAAAMIEDRRASGQTEAEIRAELARITSDAAVSGRLRDRVRET